MAVKILGWGSCFTNSSIGTSFVVDDIALWDAPPAIAKKCIEGQVDMAKIEAVFISHLHGDHFFGLPIFLLERRMCKPEAVLNIYGPKGLKDYTRQMLQLGFPGDDHDAFLEGDTMAFHDVSNMEAVFCRHLTIAPFAVRHNMPAFGYEIAFENGRRLLYSGDTDYCDALEGRIKAADVCLLDATSKDAAIPGHMNFADMEKLAASYPQKRIYAMHRSAYSAEEGVNLKLPKEFDEIRV